MADEHDGGQPPLTATAGRELTPGVRFAPLTDLGEKIFLDRYALKDASKATLAAGDLVVVCTDTATGQREVGTVLTVTDDDVAVRLRDGTELTRSLDSVDKPLETSPEQMVARVARGIAAVEPGEQRAAWEQRFRWLLSDWRFVPGGRILTAAGTDQQLTFYNCYVVPSPRDSRHGIVDTLSQMMEIMSRGGGVGINISSLRPRHAYVRGVNGRSSGAVSWGALYSFGHRTDRAGRQPPRRADADLRRLAPRRHGVHRRQAGDGQDHQRQHQRRRHRCVHGGGARGRRVATWLPRHRRSRLRGSVGTATSTPGRRAASAPSFIARFAHGRSGRR